MPIKPRKDEPQSDWMGRCVPEMIGTGDDKRPQEQAVAACLQIWRDKDKDKKKQDDIDPEDIDTPEPDDDEDYDDFMDRCTDTLTSGDGDSTVDDDTAEEACQLSWENRSAISARGVVRYKTHVAPVHAMEFVLSDGTVDRFGDTIDPDGWQLDNFLKNPIALFNHNPNFIVGNWENLHVKNGGLRGHLRLADEGTSDRIDEIRKLVKAGILKAVSVGFRELEASQRKGADGRFTGYDYTKQDLVETSLVSVPANPNALMVARSLSISPQTMKRVFAGQGRRNMRLLSRSGISGGQAERQQRNNERGATMSLSQRITDLQEQIVARKDALRMHLEKQDDTNVSDADLEFTGNLNADIARMEKQHMALVDSEKLVGESLSPVPKGRALAPYPKNGGGTGGGNGAHEIEAPMVMRGGRRKDLEPLDYMARAGAVLFASKIWGAPAEATMQKIYGDDDATRMACDLVLRAASAPAITTVAGWAAELVHQIYTDPMPLLMPAAVATRLAAKGLTLSFGRAGRIIIPTRSRTPTLAGSFVGEGQAIPVRQGAFTSQTLTPKKVAVISTYTKEMDEFSIPAIEGIIREAIQVDTTVAVDTILLDANPATSIRPPGLLNGVAALTASVGPGLPAVIGDIKLLYSTLAINTYGNVRSPVWLLNPEEVQSASLASAPNTGIFPFRDEVARGTLNNIPFIESAVVPLKTVILIDAADFVVVGAEGARMDLSDTATLHMEDTSPLDLVSGGSPAVVAAPQRSLFQTDSLALRLVMRLNWVQRRPGTIVWTQSVAW
jgi:HK97 family phage prohead protease